MAVRWGGRPGAPHQATAGWSSRCARCAAQGRGRARAHAVHELQPVSPVLQAEAAAGRYGHSGRGLPDPDAARSNDSVHGQHVPSVARQTVATPCHFCTGPSFSPLPRCTRMRHLKMSGEPSSSTSYHQCGPAGICGTSSATRRRQGTPTRQPQTPPGPPARRTTPAGPLACPVDTSSTPEPADVSRRVSGQGPARSATPGAAVAAPRPAVARPRDAPRPRSTGLAAEGSPAPAARPRGA